MQTGGGETQLDAVQCCAMAQGCVNDDLRADGLQNGWRFQVSAWNYIRIDKVAAALKKMKRCKAPGLSGLVTEMIQAMWILKLSGHWIYVTEMRIVRWMCGMKLQDTVQSKGLRKRIGLDDIISVLQQNKLRWYGRQRLGKEMYGV